MKHIDSLPSGWLDLKCDDCGTTYEYWNGSPSLARPADAPLPRCPRCGSERYTRVPCYVGFIDNMPYTLTWAQLNRAEALAMGHRYAGQQVTADDIIREYGKYIAKENEQ